MTPRPTSSASSVSMIPRALTSMRSFANSVRTSFISQDMIRFWPLEAGLTKDSSSSMRMPSTTTSQATT